MRLGPYELGPNDTPECGIYTGDAMELAKLIPDESVDLIFTDPVYDDMAAYEWLAEMAARALKPNSACLIWIATPWLSKVLEAMAPMSYAWTLIWQKVGPVYPGKAGMCKYAMCLWMEKGQSKTYRKIWDFYQSGAGNFLPIAENGHRWRKSADVLAFWLEAFTQQSAIILDPFTGGGTVPAVCKMLGRHYLAFEIDPDTAELARERVRNTQPPLFVLEPEQLELSL